MSEAAGWPVSGGMGEESRKALGDLLPEISVRPPGPTSIRMAERLALAESRNVTHLGDDFPVFWSEARGANVRDVDGNVYLDLTAAFGVASAGHAHPRIVEAIQAQSGRLIHGMGDVHPGELKVVLLERLCGLSPWEEARGVLATAGSEAVEIALKTAHLATGRVGVIAFDGAYHGLTLGALSTTARELFRRPFLERLPEAVSFTPFPETEEDGKDESARCLAALDRAIFSAEQAGTPPGAIIVEPIQGRAGVRVPPPGFLASVAERAHEAGSLLIFDEIFTGLGRTGSVFAFEHEGVIPDLLCLGKALGGGLPLSCCLGPAEVMDAWPRSEGEAIHTSTFLGHPLSCAAALAFLEILEAEDLPGRSKREGERLRSRLSESLKGSSVSVRGRGLFVGLEPDAAYVGARAGVSASKILLRDGILVLPAGVAGEVIEITPPLTTSRMQLDWAVDVIARRVGKLGR